MISRFHLRLWLIWSLVVFVLLLIAHFLGLSVIDFATSFEISIFSLLPQHFQDSIRTTFNPPWSNIIRLVSASLSLSGGALLALGGAGFLKESEVEDKKPESKPLLTDFLYIPEVSNDPIKFNAAKPTLVGREKEFAELNEFASGSETFLWWLLQGEGGIGKSKLALAWVNTLRGEDYQEAGFVNIRAANHDWGTWQPLQKTFIVLDDAAENVQLALKLIDGFSQRSLDHCVRLLLVERPGTEALKLLDTKNLYLTHRYKPPKDLEALDKQEITLIQEQFADGGNTEALMNFSEGIPFYAVLALGSSSHDYELKVLLDERVERLRNQLNEDLQGDTFYVIAMAVLTLGLPREADERAQKTSKTRLDEFFDEDTADIIPPLKPDILGEYVLLKVFEAMTKDERTKFVSRAWKIEPEAVMLSLYRLHLDFPDEALLKKLDQEPELSKKDLKEVLPYWMMLRVDRMASRKKHPNQIKVNQYLREFHHQIKVDQYLQEFHKIAKKYPDVALIQLKLAQGTVNAINVYGKDGQLDKVETLLSNLKELVQKYPNNEEIATCNAGGIVNAITAYGKDRQLDKVLALHRELTKLGLKYGNNEKMVLELIKGEENARIFLTK